MKSETMTNETTKRRLLGFAVLCMLALVVLHNAFFSLSYSIGPNYRNISVDTRVNIT